MSSLPDSPSLVPQTQASLAENLAPVAPPTSLDEEYVACNLCGGRRTRQLYPGRGERISNAAIASEVYACTSTAYGRCGPIVRCLDCGLVYINPRPRDEVVDEAYRQVVDEAYQAETAGRLATFAASVRELEAYAPHKGRLLDVGAHIGTFVEVARAAGWDAYGIEPSEWAVRQARERADLPLYLGTLADVEFAPGSFDVVTLWDVIEHLPDPRGELLRVHEVLRPGGLLAVSTMNVGAWFPRLARRRWPWYMQMHLVYFTPATLRRLLTEAGYEVIDVAPHTRQVRLSYLVSRLRAYSPGLERRLSRFVQRRGWGDRLIAVDLGDIFTIYARRV